MRRPPDDAAAMLHEAVRHSLDAHVAQGAALALGFSGGRDSAVLLDVLAALADIDAYAPARNLAWIDDESNADARHARNALRKTVMPALAALAPQASATLARAASHQAEAAQLEDELAQHDAVGAVEAGGL